VFAPFPESTEKFAAGKQWMLNFRVRDLDAMLAQLRAAGVAVEDDVQHEQGIGRFAWLSDPEGNRIELWEPDRTKFASISAAAGRNPKPLRDPCDEAPRADGVWVAAQQIERAVDLATKRADISARTVERLAR
jgi:Glyoxalase-like domain